MANKSKSKSKSKYQPIHVSELSIGDKFRVPKGGDGIVTSYSSSDGSSKLRVGAGSKCIVCKINPKSMGAHILKDQFGEASDVTSDRMTWHTCFPKDSIVEVKRKLWKSRQTDEE